MLYRSTPPWYSTLLTNDYTSSYYKVLDDDPFHHGCLPIHLACQVSRTVLGWY